MLRANLKEFRQTRLLYVLKMQHVFSALKQHTHIYMYEHIYKVVMLLLCQCEFTLSLQEQFSDSLLSNY